MKTYIFIASVIVNITIFEKKADSKEDNGIYVRGNCKFEKPASST
jgi:hypothetical protein